MLTKEQYKELKKYTDSELPIPDDGLLEIGRYLLECGYIESSRIEAQRSVGIVQFYDAAYQITGSGRTALAEYEQKRHRVAFEVFLVLLSVCLTLFVERVGPLFSEWLAALFR